MVTHCPVRYRLNVTYSDLQILGFWQYGLIHCLPTIISSPKDWAVRLRRARAMRAILFRKHELPVYASPPWYLMAISSFGVVSRASLQRSL